MSLKRKTPLAVKIIACLLLLGSLAALILPCWLKLSADVGPDQIRMNPGELIQMFSGYDAEAVKSLALSEMQASGMQTGPAVVNDLLDRLLDGHFTLPGMAALCRDLMALSRDPGELGRSFPPELGDTLNAAYWIVWGVFGLLALFGLIALICALSDRRWGILLYFLFGALTAAGLLFLRSVANGYLTENVPAWKQYGYQALEPMGLDFLLSPLEIVDLEGIVKMGIGAYLCPFLALLALLLMCIRKKQPGKRQAGKKQQPTPYPARRPAAPAPQAQTRPAPVRPAQSAPPVWFCPNCGFRNGPNLVRCQSCGLDRPGLPLRSFCTNCGESLPPEATFCFSCGQPVSPLPSRPVREPSYGRPASSDRPDSVPPEEPR